MQGQINSNDGVAGRQERPGLIIFMLWILVFTAASQIMIVAPIIPTIAENLSVESSRLGLLMTVYALAVGVVALITGPISDRFGRRKILIAGSGLMVVALGLHAFAESYETLLLVRTLAGAAGGILSGGAVSYVGDYFPVDRRGWASGMVMSGLAAGQLAGIPAGTLLAEELGFRAPFLAFAAVGFVAFLMILTKLPQPGGENGERIETLSIGSALRGYGDLLRRREVLAASAAYVMMFMGISLYVTFFPTWLEENLGFTAVMISILYIVGGSANILIGPRAGKLSDRIGRTDVIILSSVGVAIVMPLFTFVPIDIRWIVFPLFFVTMGLVAARMSPMQALMTQLTGQNQRGAFMSLITSIGQIGFAVGSALAAITLESLGFIGNALFATGSVLIMAWIVWRYLRTYDVGREEAEAVEEDELLGATPSGLAIRR